MTRRGNFTPRASASRPQSRDASTRPPRPGADAWKSASEHPLLGKARECNGNPGYHMGIIEAGLARAGAKNIRVEPFDFNGYACSYRVRWDS
ncbi:DUF2378 family protein [Corallococcus interemptor]|uniref:DUF2378 family protein n=1 Tax=Corallococcus interemptor TaxID=2316720 RepID=UPI0035D450A0